MTILIATVVLMSSISGIGLMAYKKTPILIELSEMKKAPREENLVSVLRKKIQSEKFFSNFSSEIFLQKLLSRVKTLALKTENKTSLLLQKLREKSKKRQISKKDNYWEKIKKSTRQDG